MPKYSYFDLSDDHVNEFNQLCPLNEYRILAPVEVEKCLSGIVPDGLWEKTDSLFLMSSGSALATAYCMVNCNRYDFKADAIDQEPILFAQNCSEPRLKGIIIHHGNWNGRTESVHPDFHTYLESSGIGNYYPLADLPSTTSGSISTLTSVSQIGAFDKGVKKIIRMASEESKG